MQVFTALIITALGLGVIVMIVDAFSAKSVIVEPFDAPPALAARGLSGTVIAGGVLDELTRLQAATRASVAAATCRTPGPATSRCRCPTPASPSATSTAC